MAIVQWDASRDLSLLQGDMNRLFERFFGPASTDAARERWVPPMDVAEEGDVYVVRVDLPGLADADVVVEFHDGTLSISGERTWRPRPEHDGGYARLERPFGRFQRTLNLPDGTDPDAIDASFEHGVLELRIPKPVEAQPRRIEIGASKPAIVEGS